MKVLNNNFPVGIIEGYFGEYWSMQDRLTYPKWLKEHSFNFYIYAPKNDKALRSKWDEPYNKEYLNELSKFAAECKANDIAFGVGISPKGATLDLNISLPKLISNLKVLLNELSPNIIAILFDDLKIDNTYEGKKQNRILLALHQVISEFAASNNRPISIITCPSYYSTDPILEKVFGKCPDTYFKDFIKDLPKDIDIFWTGDKVISEYYTKENLSFAEELFNRKVFIWDNYPVNDGKKASSHLYLTPFKDRTILKEFSSGIAINPMKQAHLSKIPLASLEYALSNNEIQNLNDKILETAFFNNSLSITSIESSIKSYFDGIDNTNYHEFFNFLASHANIFANTPIESFSDTEKSNIISILENLPKNVLITELINFIKGKYAFDPDCLTG